MVSGHKLVRTTLAVGGTLLLGGATYYGCGEYAASQAPFSQNKYQQKYKITDEKAFAQLYEAALPMAQLALLPIENLKGFYCDNNSGVINTCGIGSYLFPENGDPTSQKWIKTAEFYKQNNETEVTADLSFCLIDGWCRFRNRQKDGFDTMYQAMYRKLEGCELSANEFAAILSCSYQNESTGLNFCDFVRENYSNPIECARKLMCYPSEYDLRSRRTHEALVYLNLDDYVSCLPSLLYKENANPKKSDATSVNQIKSALCDKAKNDLAKGKTDGLREAKDNICGYVNKNAKTLTQFVSEKVGNKELCHKLLGGFSYGIAITFNQAFKDWQYKKALENYNDGNYQEAMQGFKNLVMNGAQGADLHNDIARTHYQLGNYQECIDECRWVLNSGEKEACCAANYTAGQVYEELKNYSKASQNYHRAAVLAEEFGEDTNVYEDAAQRMDTEIKNHQQIKKAVNTKKKSKQK